eukprot:EG_transcript_41381
MWWSSTNRPQGTTQVNKPNPPQGPQLKTWSIITGCRKLSNVEPGQFGTWWCVQARRCHCRGSELLIPQGSPQEVLEGLGEGWVGGLDGEADGGGLQVGLRGFSGLDTNPPGVSNKRGKEVGLTP